MTIITTCWSYLLLCFKPPQSLLKARFLCTRYCLASFRQAIVLIAPSHCLQSTGGWTLSGKICWHIWLFTWDDHNLCRLSGYFFLSMGSFLWWLKVPRRGGGSSQISRTGDAPLQQYYSAQSASRNQPTFKDRRIWLHLERSCKILWPWFPIYRIMTRIMVTSL